MIQYDYESKLNYYVDSDGNRTLIGGEKELAHFMWAALCRGSAKNGNQAGGGEKE